MIVHITLTQLSLDQSVCDVPSSCFTRSDNLYYLEWLETIAELKALPGTDAHCCKSVK